MKTNRRPQAPKSRVSPERLENTLRAKRDANVERIQDLRNGSRTSRIPSGTSYSRKPKYGKWAE